MGEKKIRRPSVVKTWSYEVVLMGFLRKGEDAAHFDHGLQPFCKTISVNGDLVRYHGEFYEFISSKVKPSFKGTVFRSSFHGGVDLELLVIPHGLPEGEKKEIRRWARRVIKLRAEKGADVGLNLVRLVLS